MPSPIPLVEAKLVSWLIQFSTKLPAHAAQLGLPAEEVARTLEEIAYAVYVLGERLPMERARLAATQSFKDLLLDGAAAELLPAGLPAAAEPLPCPEGLRAGVIPRLRKLVQNIKSRPDYTETIGRDLGIISTKSAAGTRPPKLKLVSPTAGAVTIAWNRSGWTGVQMQGRAKGGDWEDLGTDLVSPFIDTRPLATPGTPETREYRAAYLDGDAVQPAFSQVLQVTVIAP